MAKKEVNGYVDIVIFGQDFRLDGTVGETVEVGYRDKEVKLGTIPEIIGDVAKALVGPESAATFSTEFDKVTTSLKDVPGLGAIMDALLSMDIYVTDLFIKARTGAGEGSEFKVLEAAFGFRADFASAGKNLKLGPVELAGFGVVFEYLDDGTAGGVTSRAQTQAISY